MKTQNDPFAYGLLAGLLVFLLGLVVNAGCIHSSKLDGRDVQARADEAVEITARCQDTSGQGWVFYGSGVIVDAHTILTAGHVATAEPGMFCGWTAEMSNGKEYSVMPSIVLPGVDLASMVSMLAFDPTYPIVFGPIPKLGERVCSSTAHPMRLIRCGEAQTRVEPPGDLMHTMLVEPGNSGSGVYDTQGRLIGIVTHLMRCTNGQYCGGKLATLDGHVRELML